MELDKGFRIRNRTKIQQLKTRISCWWQTVKVIKTARNTSHSSFCQTCLVTTNLLSYPSEFSLLWKCRGRPPTHKPTTRWYSPTMQLFRSSLALTVHWSRAPITLTPRSNSKDIVSSLIWWAVQMELAALLGEQDPNKLCLESRPLQISRINCRLKITQIRIIKSTQHPTDTSISLNSTRILRIMHIRMSSSTLEKAKELRRLSKDTCNELKVVLK